MFKGIDVTFLLHFIQVCKWVTNCCYMIFHISETQVVAVEGLVAVRDTFWTLPIDSSHFPFESYQRKASKWRRSDVELALKFRWETLRRLASNFRSESFRWKPSNFRRETLRRKLSSFDRRCFRRFESVHQKSNLELCLYKMRLIVWHFFLTKDLVLSRKSKN